MLKAVNKKILSKYCKMGLTKIEIYKRLNISRNALDRYLKIYNLLTLPLNKSPSFMAKVKKNAKKITINIPKRSLERDCKAGLMQSQMADKHNVSRTTIANKLKKYGLKSKSKFENSSYKRMMSEGGKKPWRNPKTRERMIQHFKDRWKNKSFLVKMDKHCKTTYKTKEHRNLVSIGVKNRYDNDPEYKVKVVKSIYNRRNKISKPHKLVLDLLESLGVKNKCNYRIGPWEYDVFVPSHKLLIEVQGDYWHNLKSQINRDKSKRTYAKRYTDYKLKYIWEHECKVNNKLSDKKIKRKVKRWVS